MNGEIFLAALTLLGGGYVAWGIRTLPRQGWQVAAAIPLAPSAGGWWRGAVLTWYGILTANAYVAASAMVIVLLGAAHLPLRWIVLTLLLLLALCVPASALVARIVERKPATFTVGGAVFVGTLAAPWVARLVSSQGVHEGITIHPTVILAACGIGYTLGEALGRLACLSFGCCYGKPLNGLPEPIARILAPLGTVFTEPTRKAAYADGLMGVRLIPVQSLSSLILGLTSLAGVALFLRGGHAAAFLLTLTVSQLWRVGSEFLRKDFRGGGSLSAYQIMALSLLPYGWGVILLSGDSTLVPDLSRGLATLWGGAPLLSLQALWIGILLYTGISRVTGATVRIHLRRHRI